MRDPGEVIIEWISENCLRDRPDFTVTVDTPLLATNLLDSMSFLKLATFLEEQYNIKLGEDDMTPENFETPASVAGLVKSLQ